MILQRILLNFNTNICTKLYYRLQKPLHLCCLPPRNGMNMVNTVLALGNIIAFNCMVLTNRRNKLPYSIGNSGGRISFKPPILTDYFKWMGRHGDEAQHLFRQESCMCYYIGYPLMSLNDRISKASALKFWTLKSTFKRLSAILKKQSATFRQHIYDNFGGAMVFA